jgi:ketosteroid isomerase-like protein
MAAAPRSIEDRLRALEDREAIRQTICGYGYAMDGCNAPVVGSFYTEDGVYAVADVGAFEGRDAVAAITRRETHLGLVKDGCAHISTVPYVVIDGDRAVATCHTMVARHGEQGFFVGRLSASRIRLERQPDGGWQISHRQNYMLDGDPQGPAMLARLQEGPEPQG